MPPLWRKAFDAIERPLAAGSEAWIQSDTFMDLATHSIRIQRRMLREVQHGTERWLHLWGWVSRDDVLRLSNQVASLERQVRDLRREAEHRERPLLDGHQPRPRSRTRPRSRQPSNRREG
ncbi:MAG TPA: hypothetical protein VE127_04870 [Solirubrobacteraceae bacterium]|jgi:hypothetical protein|nr:hypothetical protein [Solirubrobacteraceae bacterium]